MHVSPTGDKPTRLELGSRLHLKAARSGLNFITPEVHQLVRRELILREEGAVIDVDRLFANALSSMPLCFNLLGPLALDLDLVTAVWRRLLPDFVQTVQRIGFEHSPGCQSARKRTPGSTAATNSPESGLNPYRRLRTGASQGLLHGQLPELDLTGLWSQRDMSLLSPS